MKKRYALLSVFTAVVLATSSVAVSTSGAASKGGKGSAHTSVKSRDNSNAQWRADPDKGWVRAEERQELHKDKKENSKQHRKGNAPKRSY